MFLFFVVGIKMSRNITITYTEPNDNSSNSSKQPSFVVTPQGTSCVNSGNSSGQGQSILHQESNICAGKGTVNPPTHCPIIDIDSLKQAFKASGINYTESGSQQQQQTVTSVDNNPDILAKLLSTIKASGGSVVENSNRDVSISFPPPKSPQQVKSVHAPVLQMSSPTVPTSSPTLPTTSAQEMKGNLTHNTDAQKTSTRTSLSNEELSSGDIGEKIT